MGMSPLTALKSPVFLHKIVTENRHRKRTNLKSIFWPKLQNYILNSNSKNLLQNLIKYVNDEKV